MLDVQKDFVSTVDEKLAKFKTDLHRVVTNQRTDMDKVSFEMQVRMSEINQMLQTDIDDVKANNNKMISKTQETLEHARL